MKTVKVDASKRVRIPDAKPRQVFTYESNGHGIIVLTLVKATHKERFPPGSLKKYVTAQSDKEMLGLVNAPGSPTREMS